MLQALMVASALVVQSERLKTRLEGVAAFLRVRLAPVATHVVRADADDALRPRTLRLGNVVYLPSAAQPPPSRAKAAADAEA